MIKPTSSGAAFSRYLCSYLDPYYYLAILATFPLNSFMRVRVSSLGSLPFFPLLEPLPVEPLEPACDTAEFLDFFEPELELVPFLFFVLAGLGISN